MSNKKRILVVDDELETLDLFRAILEISGFEPITVLNSVDAITIAELERPDCVLLDVMMPYLDGFTLCKMMRLHPSTKTLPIIFVTAYSALDFEDRFKESGADFTLFKPVSMDRLIESVERVLQLHPPKRKQTAKLTIPRGHTGLLTGIGTGALTPPSVPAAPDAPIVPSVTAELNAVETIILPLEPPAAPVAPAPPAAPIAPAATAPLPATTSPAATANLPAMPVPMRVSVPKANTNKTGKTGKLGKTGKTGKLDSATIEKGTQAP